MTSLDKTIVNQLIDFGLTGKEATVYLTAVESGVLSAQQLSKESGINRSSTYMALESLIAKGLVGKSTNEDGVSIYEAFGPEILLKEATEKERAQAKIHQNIDALIPELTALSSTLALHPRVRFYEGRGGIETVNHDLSKVDSKKIIRIFAVKPVISHSKSGQVIQIISPYKEDVILPSKNKTTSVHLIPAGKYTFSSDIRIYEDKIVLISENEKFAAIIEDKYFAEVMRETFDLAWEEAWRLDTQIRAKNKATR